MAEGQGQIIAGVGYIEASRSFNQSGKSVPTPTFRKAAISGFAEYGLTPGLTIIAAPTADRMHAGSPGNAYSGSDESAFGARLKLWGSPTRTLAFQVLVEPPLGGRDNQATEVALGGPHAFAIDMRLQLAQAVSVFGYPSYVCLEPGARLRGGGWPDEARFDVALGVRPGQRSLILMQGFASTAPSRTADPPHRLCQAPTQLCLRSFADVVASDRRLAYRLRSQRRAGNRPFRRGLVPIFDTIKEAVRSFEGPVDRWSCQSAMVIRRAPLLRPRETD